MNKLFKLLQESFGSAPQRNGFDLSRRDIFSTKVGMKLPVLALECVPNDYHELRPVNIVRTMPFNEANFVRMKQHIDYYFVPYSFLQSNFNEVIQQTIDPVNSLLTGDVAFFPMMALNDILFAIFYAHLRYNGETDLSILSVPQMVPYYNALTDKQVRYLFCNLPNSESEASVAVDMFDNPVYMGAVRLLDMLGYGNYLPLVTSSSPDPEFIANSIFSGVAGKYVNLYRFAAYQCVYQNYGINTTYDKLDIYSYNFDDCMVDGSPNTAFVDHRYNSAQEVGWKNLRSVFTLRYSQWKKDIFTASYPDSQFGSVSVVSMNTFVRSGDSQTYGAYFAPDAYDSSGKYIGQGDKKFLVETAMYNEAALTQFSIFDLRRAEALQGWKEDMMRSGFRARSRQKSQFGVSPRMDLARVPDIIGSVSSDIQKDIVTGTSGSEFAEQAATGMSTMGNEVLKYECKDYGIIIGLMSIVPEADYDAYGMDLHNMKSEAFDFYTPAFQNIGLQALPKEYLNISLGGFMTESVPSVIGYVPRYAEYKQAFDKLHGEFCAGVRQRSSGLLPGDFRHFVSSRVDLEMYGLSSLASLYVNPSIVDDVFAVEADGEQRTDQFHVNMYHEIKSVRPMSVLGLPRF